MDPRGGRVAGPAVGAGFCLALEHVAAKKGGPVSNPKGDYGAAE